MLILYAFLLLAPFGLLLWFWFKKRDTLLSMSPYFTTFFSGWFILCLFIGGVIGFFRPEILELSKSEDPVMGRFLPTFFEMYICFFINHIEYSS